MTALNISVLLQCPNLFTNPILLLLPVRVGFFPPEGLPDQNANEDHLAPQHKRSK